MKENHKCEQYLHIFLKLQQAGFKLHGLLNKQLNSMFFFFEPFVLKNGIFFFGIFIFLWLSWSYFFLQNNCPYTSTVALATGVIKVLRVV